MRHIILIICAVIVGCAAPGTTPPSSNTQSTPAIESTMSEAVAAESQIVPDLAVISQTANLQSSTIKPPETATQTTNLEDFNRTLANLAVQPRGGNYEYRLGVGDVITVDAFQVDELRQYKVRIEGQGTVVLPLLGQVRLAGKTVSEAEQELVLRLNDYLYDPKVSVFIDDYQSQEVTIAGEVNNPGIYPLTRPRSLVELLTMAGGLSNKAGFQVNVQISASDSADGRGRAQQLLVDLRDLVNDPDAQKALILKGGDSIFVPPAGVFFVEGAVKKPGAYPIQGEMNVIKAIAMAQGANWEAAENNVQIIRRTGNDTQNIPVDLNAVRANRSLDVEIIDGDIVMVNTDSFKFGAAVLWRGFTGIVNFGIDVTRSY